MPPSAPPPRSYYHFFSEWMPALSYTLCEQFGEGRRWGRRGGGAAQAGRYARPEKGLLLRRHTCSGPAPRAPGLAAGRACPAAILCPLPRGPHGAGHCSFADRDKLTLIDVNKRWVPRRAPLLLTVPLLCWCRVRPALGGGGGGGGAVSTGAGGAPEQHVRHTAAPRTRTLCTVTD